MKCQILFTLIGIVLFITIEGLKEIDRNGNTFKFGCHFEENHCIKIINEKKEWCYTNENGLETKEPCKTDDDCINMVECATLLDNSTTYDSDQNNSQVIKAHARSEPIYSCSSFRSENQSPINIRTHLAKRMVDWFPIQVIFPPPSTPFKEAHLITAYNKLRILKLSVPSDPPIEFKAPILENNYLLVEVRFYFGCKSDRGSEHQIDGRKYPLEVQFVFWNNLKYSSYIDARESKTKNALAIVAVLFEEDEFSNKINNLNVLTDAIHEINNKYKGQTTIKQNLGQILQALLPDDIDTDQTYRKFFTYSGSLTVPPCREVVEWFVLADCCKLKAPADFIFALQNLYMIDLYKRDYPMCDNNREIQEQARQEVSW